MVRLGKVTPKIWEDLESQGFTQDSIEEAAAAAEAAKEKAAQLAREAIAEVSCKMIFLLPCIRQELISVLILLWCRPERWIGGKRPMRQRQHGKLMRYGILTRLEHVPVGKGGLKRGPITSC